MISAYRVTVTNPDPLTIRRYRIEASTRAQACEIGIERARQELPSWTRFGQVLRAQAFPIRTREKYRKMIKVSRATLHRVLAFGHDRLSELAAGRPQRCHGERTYLARALAELESERRRVGL